VRRLVTLFLALFLWTSPLVAQAPQWQPYQAETLYRWTERAEAEGIDFPAQQMLAIEAARRQSSAAAPPTMLRPI